MHLMTQISLLQMELSEVQSQLSTKDDVVTQLEGLFVEIERKGKNTHDFNSGEWLAKRFVRAKVSRDIF